MDLFFIEDNLFEKFNTIWDKVSADIKNEFESERVILKSNFMVMKVLVFLTNKCLRQILIILIEQ